MTVIIQKYGVSSLADIDKIKNVARQVSEAKTRDDNVVVVVSAMGGATDKLINLARQITDSPDERELDALLSTGEIVSSTLLAMALESLGFNAISLTGADAVIQTDENFGKAQIQKVEPWRILEELKKGKIVVVAGFQGITEQGDITTLGRDGSDLTATVLAASLRANLSIL